MKPVIKDEFQFSKQERKAILGFFILILITFAIRYVPIKQKQQPISVSDYIRINEGWERMDKEAAALQVKNQEKFPSTKSSATIAVKKKQRFRFDPNTIDKQSIQNLGFSEFGAKNWVSFREKGKVYNNLNDIKSIYAIDTLLVAEVSDLIDFPKAKPSNNFKQVAVAPQYGKKATNKKEFQNYEKNNSAYSHVKYDKKEYPEMGSVDLNMCDEKSLQKLPGIGPFYSSRILKYRNVLGGFHSVSQLKSVYGFPDSTFQTIKEYVAIKTPPKQININILSKEQLVKHHFIDFKKAKLIISYRNQHGPFKDADDFLKMLAISADQKEALLPYLDFRQE